MHATAKSIARNAAYLIVGLLAVASLWQVSQGQSARAGVSSERPAFPAVMVTGTGSGGSVAPVTAGSPVIVPGDAVGQGGNVGR
jgi:hypothetical protein